VLPNDGKGEGALYHWGLVPSWVKDPAAFRPLINARVETLTEKPSFRGAFRHRRCLIPADGFYEWEEITGEKRKVPYYFQLESKRPFAMAGLWECRQAAGRDALWSCTIITTEANDTVRPVHSRMPFILSPEDHACWLGPGELAPGRLNELLLRTSALPLAAHPVSSRVNSPVRDDPACIESVC